MQNKQAITGKAGNQQLTTESRVIGGKIWLKTGFSTGSLGYTKIGTPID